jgi:hypothetical protein
MTFQSCFVVATVAVAVNLVAVAGLQCATDGTFLGVSDTGNPCKVKIPAMRYTEVQHVHVPKAAGWSLRMNLWNLQTSLAPLANASKHGRRRGKHGRDQGKEAFSLVTKEWCFG